jgi:hypothetical protein
LKNRHACRAWTIVLALLAYLASLEGVALAKGSFEVELRGATFKHENFPLPLTNVNGLVKVDPDSTQFYDLTFLIGNSSFNASGTFHKVEKLVSAKVTSSALDPADFAVFMPALAKFGIIGKLEVTALINGKLGEPEVEATIRSDKLTMRLKEKWAIDLSEMEIAAKSEASKYRFTKAGFKIADASIGVGASFEPSANGSLEKGAFSFKTKGLSLERLFSGHEKLANTIEGSADIDLDVSGNAGELSTYSGKGSVAVRNGRLVRIPALIKLADKLNSSKLEEISFSFIGGEFNVSNGFIEFENFQVRSEVLNADIHVKYNLSSDELDGNAGVTVFTSKLASSKGIGKLFKKVGPKVDAKFHIRGTLDRPEFDIDM